MNTKGIALIATMLLGVAGPAVAGPSATLAAGGRTLAGPGKTSMAATLTDTVYTHASTNTDACTTVINSSKGSNVTITMVGPAASTVTLDVAPSDTATLCHDGVVRVDLTCVDTDSACVAQWRVDRN
jgi:hypothetical protein